MIIYVAIRDVDGEEVIDRNSARHLEHDTKKVCELNRRQAPGWDARNPIIRIAKFQCKEIR